jgi:transposase
LSAAFIKAVKAGAPNAKQIYDRFHIQRLAHDALDDVRRDLVCEADDGAERKALKGTRWALQHPHRQRLKQEREARARLRPRHLHLPYAVIWTPHTRHPRPDE